MTTAVHKHLVADLCRDGWTEATGWKEAVKNAVLAQPYCGEDGLDGLELSRVFSVAPVHPDAYRIKYEHEAEGWLDPVVVIELAEVVVTYDLTKRKLQEYEHLWWDCDGSGHVHLRLYTVNREGDIRCLVDIDPELLELAISRR